MHQSRRLGSALPLLDAQTAQESFASPLWASRRIRGWIRHPLSSHGQENIPDVDTGRRSIQQALDSNFRRKRLLEASAPRSHLVEIDPYLQFKFQEGEGLFWVAQFEDCGWGTACNAEWQDTSDSDNQLLGCKQSSS